MTVGLSEALGKGAGIVDRALNSESFDDQFIELLSKALIPTCSENAKTSRTDNLILAAILDACIGKGTILDLCCGWPLLLEKLIEQLLKDKKRETEYHYVACDMIASTEDFKRRWRELEERAKEFSSFRMSPIPTDVSNPKLMINALRTAHPGKFDFIVLANSLHEIPPSATPELLFTLVELLEDNGHLVLLDPEPSWLLHGERWEEAEELNKLTIDWEARAVWLPQVMYQTMLEKFGCTVKELDAPRSQEFWVLQITRPPGNGLLDREKVIKEATEIIQAALHLQLRDEIRRYVECREGLSTQLSKPGMRPKKKLLNKAVEFFSVCASQARRFEVAIEVGKSDA